MIRTYTNFAGGKNSHGANPIVVDQGQTEALLYAEDSYNWEMSEKGLIKSPGFVEIIDTPDDAIVTGDFEYNGTSRKRILCKGTKVYEVSGDTETEIYPLGGANQTADAYYQALEWDNGTDAILILMNGVDKPLVYNGTTCVQMSVTDPDTIWDDARPFTGCVFRGRVFFMDEDFIYTPQPDTYSNFDNTSSTVDRFPVETGHRGKLTGLLPFTDDILMIYKERCIRRLSGSAPFGSDVDAFYLAPVTNDYGCVAPRSLQQVGLEHYFISEQGVRNLKPIDKYGDIDPLLPSYNIQDEVIEWNWDAIENACAVFHQPDNHYYFAVPYGSSLTNNRVYTLDVITGGIDPRKTDDILASTLLVYNRELCHGDYDGQLYRHGSSNGNNGEDIEAVWYSKRIVHYSSSVLKRYKRLTLEAEADGEGDVLIAWTVRKRGQETVRTKTGTIQSGVAWDSGNWDSATWSSGEQNTFTIKNLGRGSDIIIRISNVSATQRPKIRSIDLEVEPLGVVRG